MAQFCNSILLEPKGDIKGKFLEKVSSDEVMLESTSIFSK